MSCARPAGERKRRRRATSAASVARFIVAFPGTLLDAIALALQAGAARLLVGLLPGLLLLRGLLLALLGRGRILLAALAARHGRARRCAGARISADRFAHHRAARRTPGAGAGRRAGRRRGAAWRPPARAADWRGRTSTAPPPTGGRRTRPSSAGPWTGPWPDRRTAAPSRRRRRRQARRRGSSGEAISWHSFREISSWDHGPDGRRVVDAGQAAPAPQAMMFTPPSTYIVSPVMRRAYGVAR